MPDTKDNAPEVAEPVAPPAPPAPEVVAAPEPFLVPLVKGAELLRVHPTCVAAHISAGWLPAE